MSSAQEGDFMYINLAHLLPMRTVDEQCTAIAEWLAHQHHVDVIGFFLQGSGSLRAYDCCQSTFPKEVGNPDDLFPIISQSEQEKSGIFFMAMQDGELIAVNPQEIHNFPAPLGMAIPLEVPDCLLGTLVVGVESGSVQTVATDNESWLASVPFISSLLQNAVDHERKDKKIRFLNLYQNVSSSLAYIGDMQELLTTIISIVSSELLCEECSVLLYDDENNEFEFYSVVGETSMELDKKRFPADRGIAGRTLRERTTQIVNDVQSDPDFYGSIDEDHNYKTKSLLVAPLVSGDEPVGVINAVNKLENKLFNQEDDQILSAIADEVAMAVKNARLFDFVVDSYCKIRQGHHSCKGCKRPLKSWTPCVKYLNLH